MNISLQIILWEAFIILSLVVIGIAVYNWRRTKSRQAALTEMLDQVAKNEPLRKEKLIRYLVGNHNLDNKQSAELCEDFIEAEKQFIYEFIMQQLGQTPVSDFYHTVCRLLDNYLQLLADTLTENTETEPQSDSDQRQEALTAATDQVEEIQPMAEEQAELSESTAQDESAADTEQAVPSGKEIQDDFAGDSVENPQGSDSTTEPEIKQASAQQPDEFADDPVTTPDPLETATAPGVDGDVEKDEFADDDEVEPENSR